jgi:small subunit ribosomal protein S17
MTDTATTQQQRKALKGIRLGTVTSDKRDKTIKVEVAYLIKAPKYGKYIRRRTAYQVHDPQNEARIGDKVEIAQCRKLSKTKSWRLVRVVETAADRAHD